MTGLLKDLMHDRADEIGTAVLDLDAITSAGDRRVRRRRGAAGALAVAAAVAVGVTGPNLLDREGDRVEPAEWAVSEAPALTWAEGSVIHSGDRTVDVGHEVHAFVTTPRGYYFTDPDGTVWSWSADGAERAGSVGSDPGGRRLLAADESGVAWIEQDGARSQLHLDLPSGGLHALPLAGGGAEVPELFAVSDGTAYYFDGTDTLAADFDDRSFPDVRVLSRGRVEIADVDGDLLLATFREPTRGGDAGDGEVTVVTRDLADRSRPLGVSGGDLSPGARYVMSENSDRESDRFTLLDLESGDDLTPPAAAGYDFFLGYAWIDEATYTAFGLRGVTEEGDSDDAAVELLVCTVATRDCTVGGRPGSPGDFQVPVGEHVGD